MVSVHKIELINRFLKISSENKLCNNTLYHRICLSGMVSRGVSQIDVETYELGIVL